MEHTIIIESELEGTQTYEALLRRVIPAALAAEGVEFPCEVDILFTDDTGIQEINREQWGVDKPTDVLSFPRFELTPGVVPTQAQGEEYGHGSERELAYLAVHSILHLLGYDHLDEGPMKAQMRAREEAILSKLGITRE